MEVKAFGGGDVLPVLAEISKNGTVGHQNRNTALEVLRDEGFKVIAHDLGDSIGRVIHFHTGTGESSCGGFIPLQPEDEDLMRKAHVIGER